ncbi:Protein CL16A, variant 3 [Entomophthora muscae]|uniref:Protein CL16A, variant 3 n=1 Tax=Entomophthora muscae TaxID=34485 RepID=A0ACC2TF05_9FUNG|nr:Protein CL16A, variant 3 [Entomophthora muscae]
MCWILGLGTSPNAGGPLTTPRWRSSFRSSASSSSLSTPSSSPKPSSRELLQSDSSFASTLDVNLGERSELTLDLIQLKIQVLQSLNILFESLRSSQVFYYLLSNNFVNRLVTRPRLDVQTHDELVPYYVSLLKALSAKLAAHPDTLAPFFFNAQSQNLPIYAEAIKYYNHSDAMVRVAIRTLTLNVFSVKNDGFSQVVVNDSNSHYLLNVLAEFSEIPSKMQASLGFNSGNLRRTIDGPEFRRYLAEFLENLDYLGDILRLAGDPLLIFVRTHMLQKVIEPLIYNQHQVRPTLHLLLINHLFQGLDDAPLINIGLQRLFDLDSSVLNGPSLSRILPPPAAGIRISQDEDDAFFVQHLKPTIAADRNDLFRGHATIWDVLDGLLQSVPSRRCSLSAGDPQPLSQIEPQLILLLILAQILSKKSEIRSEWLIALGVCPVRQLRSWFIMDCLTSKPRIPGDVDALDVERATIRNWLGNPDSPNQIWYSPKAPQVLLKLLTRNSRLHYITPRLAATLLFDLTYFPGTEACLCSMLSQRLQTLVTEMSHRLGQYIAHTSCPLALVLHEFEQFQDKIDGIPARILGIDALVLFSAPLDPISELASPLAQVSRVTQMFLIFHRLSHWLLRTGPAIPTWWKEIQSCLRHQPVLPGQTLALDNYQSIHVEIASSSPPATLPYPGSWLLLFKDSQTQFILASLKRKSFTMSRKANVIKVFSLLEYEFQTSPDNPQQLVVQKLGFRAPEKGLAKFQAAQSFPRHHPEWGATLQFQDYVDACQAKQNLLTAQLQCTTQGRQKLAKILGLSFPTVPKSLDPLGASLLSSPSSL